MTHACARLPPRSPRPGKVRELYAVGDDQLLLVACDRISAYDVRAADPDPGQGRGPHRAVGCGGSSSCADVVPDHLVTADVAEYPAELAPYADALRGRSMLVPPARHAAGRVRGPRLPRRRRARRLPRDRRGLRRRRCPPASSTARGCPTPIFTPATKAEVGEHDENDHFADVVAARSARPGRASCGGSRWRSTRRGVGDRRRARASSSPTPSSSSAVGADGVLSLGDEVLTPDSSRFWPADAWAARRRRSRRSTSSTSATGSRPPAGTGLPAAGAADESWQHPGALRRGVRAAHRPRASPDRLPRDLRRSAPSGAWKQPGPQISARPVDGRQRRTAGFGHCAAVPKPDAPRSRSPARRPPPWLARPVVTSAQLRHRGTSSGSRGTRTCRDRWPANAAARTAAVLLAVARARPSSAT